MYTNENIPPMKNRFLQYFTVVLFISLFSVESKSQNNVGIGTSTPDPWALVDMVSVQVNPGQKGLLIPRMDSTLRKSIGPVPAIPNGLLVYDTDYNCFFYYVTASSSWISLCNALGPVGATGATGPTGPTGPAGATGATSPATCNVAADLTLGSAGVTSGLVSVTDSCGVVTGTNAAWITTGNYNTTAGTNYLGTNDATDLVFKTGGTASANERMRLLSAGQVTVNRTSPLGGYVFSSYATAGINTGLGDTAIAGYSTGARVGVYGVSTTGSGVMGRSSVNGHGVYGISTGNASGVRADNTSGGKALDARNTGSGDGASITSVSGHGAVVSTNAGSGGFSLWSLNQGATNGTAIAGEGAGLSITYFTAGSVGGVFNGQKYGVYGYSYAGNGGTTTAGGFFRDSISATNDYNAYVAAYIGATNYKIMGTGAVSTIVDDTKGGQAIMYAPEAPEVLFEDYGTGKLANGQAYINLDPIFAKNVTINDKHPLRVYVQLEGECKGVYVTEKTANGFLVKELGGGTSNVSFSYHVVANRADSYKNGVMTSKYADLRFTPFEGFPKSAGGVRHDSNEANSQYNRMFDK